jgi:hypothetical protein
MRGFMMSTPHPMLFNDQIKKDKMARPCDTYGREKKCIQGENITERDHLEELGIDGRKY